MISSHINWERRHFLRSTQEPPFASICICIRIRVFMRWLVRVVVMMMMSAIVHIPSTTHERLESFLPRRGRWRTSIRS